MHGCTIFKHLHDLRYDPIQFQIQYMDVTPSKFLNICMPWNISKYDLIQFQIQYMDLPLSNSRTYAFPQLIVNQFQIPIHRVTILSLFTYRMTLIRTEMTQSNFQSNTWLLVIPFWTFLIINMNRDISQSNSKSQYVGSPSYHCSDIKWLPRNNPIQFPIKYVDIPLWQFFIINVSRISQPNSKSQYVGSPSYHRHHIQSSRGKPIQFQIKYTDLPLWTFLGKNILSIQETT